MKYLLLLFAVSTSAVYSQKLVTNSKDEFTGKIVKQTSVEALAAPFKMTGYRYDFSIKQVDSNCYFNLRLTSLSNSVFSIKDGDQFAIKFQDGSVVELTNTEYAISERGKGSTGLSGSMSFGVSLFMLLSKENIDALLSKKITKVRIYTTDGYSDQDIKSNADKKVKAALKLILN